jgi:predicted SprT family Zn-dependent metalloprotease
MINIYEYTIRETMAKASSMLRVKRPQVTVEFSMQKTIVQATCWPYQFRIRYYRWWLEANKHNTRFIDDIITHECAHLVTGPDHDARFYRLCRKYGAIHEETWLHEKPYHVEIPAYMHERYADRYILECKN